MVISKLNDMKIAQFIFIVLFNFTSCNVYRNSASHPISIGAINLGINKVAVLSEFGEPFSQSVQIVNNDTLSILFYKSPKVVANCEYIVTTELLFTNNTLVKISQNDFFVPQYVIFCDSTNKSIVNEIEKLKD